MTTKRRLKRAGIVAVCLLGVAVFIMTLVEIWMILNVTSLPAYGAIQASDSGYPPDGQAGAFLQLNDPHNAKYPGNLLMLLATTDPGVVDTSEGAHLLSPELKAVLVTSSAISNLSDYRVYRIGVDTPDQMTVTKQPDGKSVLITPTSGKWEPGNYLVDIPSEGMFGGRTYYQFYIDQGQ